MKIIHKFYLYSLAIATIFVYNLINTAEAYAPQKIAIHQPNSNEYINLSKSTFDLMMYHTGGPDSFHFYGEYRAQKLNDGDFLFPLRSCDQLSLKTFGDLRYFFISAISGAIPQSGAPVKVEDPVITNIIVVRGKDDYNGNRVEVYLGYNKNSSKKQGRKKIYSVKLLALSTKSTKHVEETHLYLFNEAKHALSDDISREIMKKSLAKGLERKDLGWNNPAFMNVFKELLGDGWAPYNGILGRVIPKDTFIRDEEIIGNGWIFSNKVYWTATENKLKGITYKH